MTQTPKQKAVEALGSTDVDAAQALMVKCPKCEKTPPIHDSGVGWGYHIRCPNRHKCPADWMRRSGGVSNIVEAWSFYTAMFNAAPEVG